MPKKEHIIKNAIELFAEKGFEGTSIRELAAKANVNVAMVNYYFGSKEKLFETMVELKASYMKGIIEELVKDKTKTEIEKIDTIIADDENRRFEILKKCLRKKNIPRTQYLKFGECMAYMNYCGLWDKYFNKEEVQKLYDIWTNFKSK